MSEWVPLNPVLYQALLAAFGDVKVEKKGQRLFRRVEEQFGRIKTRVLSSGETYRVNCPVCGDKKKHLYINYTFGQLDPATGRRFYLNQCYRCGPRTDYLRQFTEWSGFRRQDTQAVIANPEEVPEKDPYIPPGECLPLTDTSHELVVTARQYLLSRNMDPDRIAHLYGVRVCIEGNPEVANGAMTGRIIFPMVHEGEEVGWQGRLAHEPHPLAQYMKGLRWYSMPGNGWRSRHLFGYDAARCSPAVILLEGPTDTVKQGPPCVGSLGQTFTYEQAELVGKTWGRNPNGKVILAGDPKKEAKGTEDQVQSNTVELLLETCVCPIHHVILPPTPGDPGMWDPAAFRRYILEWINRYPRAQRQTGDMLMSSLLR